MGVVYRSRRRTLRFPEGLLFHIAPGNADTVFVYSWALAALAALAGNRNAVRVSERGGAATEAVLSALAQSLDQADPVVAGTQRIVSYDHLDEAATAELSAACDLRVLWGSDQAITDIRRSPLAARRSPLAARRSPLAARRSPLAATAIGAGYHLSQPVFLRRDLRGGLSLGRRIRAQEGSGSISFEYLLIWSGCLRFARNDFLDWRGSGRGGRAGRVRGAADANGGRPRAACGRGDGHPETRDAQETPASVPCESQIRTAAAPETLTKYVGYTLHSRWCLFFRPGVGV